eukprot:scaffold64864_cov64-Phaeocystis_antarctica.AAC.8
MGTRKMRAGLPYHVRKIGTISLNSSRKCSARNVAGRSTELYVFLTSEFRVYSSLHTHGKEVPYKQLLVRAANAAKIYECTCKHQHHTQTPPIMCHLVSASRARLALLAKR